MLNKTVKITKKNKGFTLIELAIVIVIIGLLVGGVLQGQELIKQASYRKDITKISQLNSAISSFYGKYNFIPGDYPNALSTVSLGVVGGDGDGKLTWGDSIDDTAYFMRQLAASKLITLIRWDGYPWPSSSVSRYSNFRGAYKFESVLMYALTGDLYKVTINDATAGINIGNSITLASCNSICSDVGYAAITSENARVIDEKIDDGNPTTGKAKGAHGKYLSGGYTTCFSGSSYIANDSTISCRFLFEFGF